MNKIKMLIAAGFVAASALACGFGAMTPAVYAEGEGGGDPAATAQSGLDAVNPDNDTRPLMDTVKVIINTVLTVVGIIAVVFIIMGGINYTMSQGDPGKITKAKNTIIYAIIGLVVVLLAFAIVNFVLGQLTR